MMMMTVWRMRMMRMTTSTAANCQDNLEKTELSCSADSAAREQANWAIWRFIRWESQRRKQWKLCRGKRRRRRQSIVLIGNNCILSSISRWNTFADAAAAAAAVLASAVMHQLIAFRPPLLCPVAAESIFIASPNSALHISWQPNFAGYCLVVEMCKVQMTMRQQRQRLCCTSQRLAPKRWKAIESNLV